ncbi:MAG: TIGR02594 family protein [Rhizobiaceae bacterium]|nr:TIGR02594 family protein [Rhizobiaceae bacterium]
MTAPWIDVANSLIGTSEKRGSVDNPDILEMFRLAGHGWVKDDETPWCAAFVGACLRMSGFASTGKLNARSYLEFGEELDEPKQGCVVVFWRGSKSGAFGHVGFYEGEDGNKIRVLGGNQGAGSTESVNVKSYPKSRLLGYRWPVVRAAVPGDTSLPSFVGGVISTPSSASSAVITAGANSGSSDGLPKEFFDAVRGTVFGGRLTQSAVDNMNKIVGYWVEDYADHPTNQLAYVLATVLAEVGLNMRPVRESFASSDAKARERVRGRRYGRPAGPYNHVYYGRGYVQLTWLRNYKSQSAKLGIDLVQFPDKALETEIALQILVDGMIAGDFSGTGHGLGYYVNSSKQDFVGARYTVNVQDRAHEIAGYANTFLFALEEAQRVTGSRFGLEALVADSSLPTRSPTRIGGDGVTNPEPVYRDQGMDDNGSSRSVIRSLLLALAADRLRSSGKGKLADALMLMLDRSRRSGGHGNLPEEAITAALADDAGESSSTSNSETVGDKPPLTPVNAALGEGIGNLLNGRKTGLGIAGLLAAVLLPELNPELAELIGMGLNGMEVPVGGEVSQGVQPPSEGQGQSSAGEASGSKPNLWLPIFSALSAWGVLGKAEKWVQLVAASKRR